jgi:mitochondrial fission protein ELM1
MSSCWILTEGMMGTQNQCVALANAAGLNPEIKVVKLRNPWKFWTPWVRAFSPRALTPESSVLKAPWPDVLIASGRKAIAPALWIKQQSGGKTKLVIIQSPVIKDDAFDLVIVPRHDNYKGNNVLELMGALSVITPQVLAQAREEWRLRLESVPVPRVAVLIGGNSRTHKMTGAVTEGLSTQLVDLAKKNIGLMITASRRTPTPQLTLLHQTVAGRPSVLFWNGTGDNPYRGFLAWADALIVSEDSVSMACEAVATGKPVYIVKMEGGSPRFKRFHDYLIDNHYARWFEGSLESWDFTPPNDLERAAEAVKALIN